MWTLRHLAYITVVVTGNTLTTSALDTAQQPEVESRDIIITSTMTSLNGRTTSKGRVTNIDKSIQMQLLSRENFLCFKNFSTSGSKPGHCPRVWDGLSCWPESLGGLTVVQPCPLYVDNFIIDANVTRECQENGEWYWNEELNRTWSNYTACINKISPTPRPSIVHPIFMEHMKYMRIIYQIGYSISLITLLVAVLIMLAFRKLHCPRNTVHVNLFVSFIIRAVMALLRDSLMSDSVGLHGDQVYYHDNDISFADTGSRWRCRLIMTLFNYATTANYTWIFIEALYLHTLLFVAVFSENSGVRLYISLGWLGPLVCTVAWVIAKLSVADHLCWNTYLTAPAVIWIIAGPVLITIIANFVFFINIIYSLFNKLKAFNNPESHKYRHRRLAKSALVLIPLFGVPYIIFLGAQYYYIDGRLELAKLYFEMTFNSFNGFLIALLYCFLNAEVQMEVRKKWQHYRVVRFGALGSTRRLTTTVTTYAAVPPTDSAPTASRRSQQPATCQPAQPPQPAARTHRGANDPDVIDDTVTSWIPTDGRGVRHDDDVSDGDIDAAKMEGCDALRMTRLEVTRY